MIRKTAPLLAGATPGRSKYGIDTSSQGKADRTVNGILFASKREARRYQQLVMLERCGEIFALKRQTAWSLDVRGQHVCNYVDDFNYTDATGQFVVEDVKGHLTAEYRLKKKLMLACHGITLRET